MYTVHCTNTFYIYLVGLLLVSVEGGVHCTLYKYIYIYLVGLFLVSVEGGVLCTLYKYIRYLFSRVVVG